jgi:carbon-monoxide dehydrogenase medium subunit
LKQFDYHEPASLEQASALLSELGANTSLMAGGTDLLVEIKEDLRRVRHVINIKKIDGLDELSFDAERGLFIGSLVTCRQVETFSEVVRHYPNLAVAVSLLGSVQVRNRATVVGNICRASPSADTIPPLMADAAKLVIFSRSGSRKVALDEFFVGPGRTVLRPDEVVTAIEVPPPPRNGGKAYIKHGRRRAMELATVGVAVSLEQKNGQCSDIRIALGAVAPTPIRARQAEARLRGRAISAESLSDVAEAAMAEATPISNVRASAGYRKEMVGVLTRRAIGIALEALS